MSISVLMSVYHKEKKDNLYNAILSVIHQTILPDEIVIVKDGPLPQELCSVLDFFKSKYPDLIKIFSLEKNEGLAYALSFGLSQCSSTYVSRMDTDDIALPGRLEETLYIMKQENLDILGGQIIEFDNITLQKIGMRRVPINQSDIVDFAHHRNPFNHMTVTFKKEKIEQIGSYHNYKGFEDYELWIRCILANYRMKNSDSIYAYVRSGSDLIDRRGGINYLLNNFKFRKDAYINLRFYTFFDFIITVLGVSVSSLLGRDIRQLLYNKLLRNSEYEKK